MPPSKVRRNTSASRKAKTSCTWARSGPDGRALFPARSGNKSIRLVRPKSKLTKAIRKPKATWVEAKLFADVEYRDITSEGLLRASSFKGLSQDKA